MKQATLSLTKGKIHSSESAEQSALFEWRDVTIRQIPELSMLFAIPNGGWRHPATAKRLKAEGVQPGVPDVFLPVGRGGYLGLWIEMKVPRNVLSNAQSAWLEALRKQGHKVKVAYAWTEARDYIVEYLR